ncbi:MAG: hypothetical protein IAI50_02550 [Candidatus Eremiobacteraeota bacterium]|nr:hypothetical protein [Candidatus Eremiobacteraeota bacterium]
MENANRTPLDFRGIGFANVIEKRVDSKGRPFVTGALAVKKGERLMAFVAFGKVAETIIAGGIRAQYAFAGKLGHEKSYTGRDGKPATSRSKQLLWVKPIFASAPVSA